MNVYYNKAWGAVITALSSVVLLLNLYLYSLNGKIMITNLLAGFLVLTAGILYLTRPYFYFSHTEIRLFAPLGHTVKHYVFDSIQSLEITGNRIYYSDNGRRKKIRITRWMTSEPGWKALEKAIRGEGELMDELHNV